MIRLLAGLFSFVSIGGIFAVGGLAALVHLYGKDLPSHEELINYQPKMLSRVYSGEGKVIAQYATEKRIFAPIEEIPPLVRNAFISAEDKNFYSHPGIDAVGIGKALVRYGMARSKGQDARLSGASTISQQVMKNFLVGNARSFERKIKEGILAVRLDGALSKDHILELYMNEIFLGARSYGIMAAAQNYFGKSMEELTPAEAAYLAALPKAPSTYHPIKNRERAIARRNYVLEEMAQNGYITRSEATAAKQEPLETLVGKSGPDVLADADPDYFTSEVRRQLISEVGSAALYEGGLTIRATVEPELQQVAARALRNGLEKYDRGRGVYHGPLARIEELDAEKWADQLKRVRAPRDIAGWSLAVVLESGDQTARIGIEAPEGPVEGTLNRSSEKWVNAVSVDGKRVRARKASDLWSVGDVILVAKRKDQWTLRQIPEVEGAFMAMDPHTGRVLALQGGFSYEFSVFNRATQAQRQPGSSFKPFVYAAALDAGYSPATIVLDAPIVVRTGGKAWRPKNSSGNFYGPTPLRKGLELSRNLMTVRIAQQVGMDRVADYAERFGVYENMPHHLSYALGAGETTLYNMVAAYGMIANGGKRVRPTVVDRVQDRHGKTLFRHDPRSCDGCTAEDFGAASVPVLYDTRSRIMSPATSRQLVSMMQGVVLRGTASRTVGDLGFPLAGKTGTTNDSRDAWFVGFSPNMVAGCFIGYDQPQPMGRGAYGGTLCGPVFKEFMVEAMKTRTPGSFQGGNDQGLVMVKIDRDTGERLPDDATGSYVLTEYFTPGTEPPLYGSYYLDRDEELFDTVVVADLPFADLEDDQPLPFDESGNSAPDQPAEQGNQAPRPPQPPSGGGLDLGTGGLY
ncbi:penicillin-binding protein 1A [Rhodobacteraceae bacterium NNCM2]|nr:penicillin-binding protein 1A [Coraliihabitans acroporae]